MNSPKMRSKLARAVVKYLEESPEFPFARLENAVSEERVDILDIVVHPQLPQDRTVAILHEEPIRILFAPDDSLAPSVYSRRENFPHNLVHTNYSSDADGLCLCMWEERWQELRSGLTPQALIERIRQWFTRTATGELHQDGQPLEPLLPATAHTLIVPSGPPAPVWMLSYVNQHEKRWTVAVAISADGVPIPNPPRFSVLAIETAPVVHGAVRQRPSSLAGVCALFADLGTDLKISLRDRLLAPANLQNAHQRYMLLILKIPKVREAGGAVMGWDYWAFMPDETLAQVGEALGCTYHDPETKITGARVVAGTDEGLASIRLDHWRVVERLNRATARAYAGTRAAGDLRFVGIGAGAVGSNVIIGTVRAGAGTWIIIDDDIVLPHNTVRQFQGDRCVGFGKAQTLSIEANAILEEVGAVGHIRADVLNPGEQAAFIMEHVHNADVVIDFSASPAVLGHVSDYEAMRRAASIFLNPEGTDLVLLAEDTGRALRLDEIEAQYFLALTQNPALTGHLSSARLDFVRYANACQDLSRPVPPWQVHVLSGIASGQVVGLSAELAALAKIWRLDPGTAAISYVSLAIAPVQRREAGGWRVSVTEEALQSMARLRLAALPQETGGVLIGSFDLTRRVLHIVTALPAPADSTQNPTYFVRGTENLKQEVARLAGASMGILGYLGEWHSHPDRASARPSRDDEGVFAYLSRHIGPTGTPYLMAICGSNETWFRLGVDAEARGEFAIGVADG
jgi:integrative and conjugative element protein (TIGR02256 family)